MIADLTSALLILVVGMITVFIILALVTWVGKALILIVNRRHELEELKASKSNISKEVIAVAAAVIHEITDGQGQIRVIKKK